MTLTKQRPRYISKQVAQLLWEEGLGQGGGTPGHKDQRTKQCSGLGSDAGSASF